MPVLRRCEIQVQYGSSEECAVAKRVVWKEGDVVCLKLRDGLFSVGQMARSPHMGFFNVQNATGEFGAVNLNLAPMFFVIPVARDFLQRRVEGKLKSAIARTDMEIPRLWLRAQRALGQKFIWKGADLVEIDPKVGDLGMNNRVVQRNFQPKNARELNQYEVTNIRTDGGLVQRLIICLERGENVDPFREKILTGEDPYGLYD